METALQDTAQRLREIERAQADSQVTGRASASLGAAVSMLQASLESGSTVECVEMAQRVLDAVDAWLLWARETEEKFSAPVEARDDDIRDPLEAVLAILQHVTAQRAQGLRGVQERVRLEEERGRIAAALLRAQRAFRLADATYTAFLRARNAEIQRIFDALRHDLVAFYDYLHPGEGHSALSIAMDPRKRGSSDLRMGFYAREDEDPRAFASEGHLDSLGLCIFLAFARRFNSDWPLLILDDVVSSVDAAHKRRVADLLFREFGERQLIITTHDSRWFTDLRRAQEESGHSQDTSNVIIESWTLEAGPVFRTLP
jgi:hypothetical protein